MIRLTLRSKDARVAGSTLGTSIAVLVLSLVGGVALARSLGVDGRGQVAALVLWSSLAMDVSMVGSNASTIYHIARFPLDRYSILVLLRRAVPAMAVAGVAVYVGFVAVSDLSGTDRALAVFAAYVPLRIVYEQVLSIVQGDQEFGRYNLARLVVAAVAAAAFTLAWLAGLMSVALAGVGYAGSLLLGLVVLLVTPRMPPTTPAGSHAPVHSFDAREYWGYALRNWPAVLAAKGNSNVDVLILSLLATTSTLGLYAVSISAASVMTLVGTAAGIVGLPRLASVTSSGEARRVYRTLLMFTIAGTLALAVMLFVSAELIVPIVFGADFSEAVPIVRILAVGYVGVSLAGFAAAVLRSRNRPGTVAVAQGAGMVITIAVALMIGPRSGESVALASALGFWVSAAIQLLAGWYTRDIPDARAAGPVQP